MTKKLPHGRLLCLRLLFLFGCDVRLLALALLPALLLPPSDKTQINLWMNQGKTRQHSRIKSWRMCSRLGRRDKIAYCNVTSCIPETRLHATLQTWWSRKHTMLEVWEDVSRLDHVFAHVHNDFDRVSQSFADALHTRYWRRNIGEMRCLKSPKTGASWTLATPFAVFYPQSAAQDLFDADERCSGAPVLPYSPQRLDRFWISPAIPTVTVQQVKLPGTIGRQASFHWRLSKLASACTVKLVLSSLSVLIFPHLLQGHFATMRLSALALCRNYYRHVRFLLSICLHVSHSYHFFGTLMLHAVSGSANNGSQRYEMASDCDLEQILQGKCCSLPIADLEECPPVSVVLWPLAWFWLQLSVLLLPSFAPQALVCSETAFI